MTTTNETAERRAKEEERDESTARGDGGSGTASSLPAAKEDDSRDDDRKMAALPGPANVARRLQEGEVRRSKVNEALATAKRESGSKIKDDVDVADSDGKGLAAAANEPNEGDALRTPLETETEEEEEKEEEGRYDAFGQIAAVRFLHEEEEIPSPRSDPEPGAYRVDPSGVHGSGRETPARPGAYFIPGIALDSDVPPPARLRRGQALQGEGGDVEEGVGSGLGYGIGAEVGDASVEHSAVVSTVYVVDDDVMHGTVVVDDDSDDNAADREEADNVSAERTEEADRKLQTHRRRLMVAALVILVAICAVLAVLGGTGHLGGGKEDQSSTSEEPSRYEAMRFIIVSNSVSDAALFDDPNTPQSQALRWLSDEDGVRLSPTIEIDRVVQRYVMAVIYFSTDGPHWYNSCEFLTDMHECDWSYLTDLENPDSYKGLHCESTLESSVTHVHMFWNNMTGTLLVELGSLEKLVDIHFNINNMEGTIPSEWGTLPRLQTLFLSDNFLTGQIPTELGQLRYLRSFMIYVNPELTGNMDFMCPLVEDLPGNLRFTAVNCGGITPEIECSCCSHCCDQETRFCCSNDDGSCWDSTPNEFQF